MEASLPVQDLELFQSSQVGFRHAAFRVAERSALPPPMRADTCQSTAFEYQRDAKDLLALAVLGCVNGAGSEAVQDYVDRSLLSVRGADKALQRMVPLLPS